MNRFTPFLNARTRKALEGFDGLTLLQTEKELLNKPNKTAVLFVDTLKETIAEYGKSELIGKEYIKAKNQNDIVNYFETITKNTDKEAVHALYLDAKNKIIALEKVSEGTLTQSVVYPREIIKRLIYHGALSVVLIHNHPSGEPAPSENDKRITKRLLFALKNMDGVLLDHIITGTNGNYFSFYDSGILREYNTVYIDGENDLIK